MAVQNMLRSRTGIRPFPNQYGQRLSGEIRDALEASGATRALPPDLSADQLAQAIVQFAPTALSTGATLMQLANLYLAARSVQLSQRLRRPWRWLRVPRSSERL